MIHPMCSSQAYFPLDFFEDFNSPFSISTSISAPHLEQLSFPLKFQCFSLSR